MATLSKEEIIRALERLGQLAQAQGYEIELIIDQIWQKVEPYLVRGDELKAQYAYQDLWELIHGDN
jgi:hypothetical protein